MREMTVGKMIDALEAYASQWGNLNCPEKIELVACRRRAQAVAQIKIGDKVVWSTDSQGHEERDAGLEGAPWTSVGKPDR